MDHGVSSLNVLGLENQCMLAEMPLKLAKEQTKSDWSKGCHPKVEQPCFLLTLSGHLTNCLTLNRQAN